MSAKDNVKPDQPEHLRAANVPPEDTAAREKAPRPKRGRNPHVEPQLGPMPRMATLEEAAPVLRLSVKGLRMRCHRNKVVGPDGSVSAQIAPGIVAVKMGKNSWRVRFDK